MHRLSSFQFLGFLKLSLTASLVISLKTTRFSLESSSSKIFDKCQAIASPSRSGSLARKTFFAFFACFSILLQQDLFPRIVIYFVRNYLQCRHPFDFFGKSLTCPIEAITLYFLPKYFSMVLLLQAIQQ